MSVGSSESCSEEKIQSRPQRVTTYDKAGICYLHQVIIASWQPREGPS